MDLDISTNKYLKSLDKNKPIICAVSGGVDSIVLFDLLKKAGFKIIVAHINHHKREQSEIEEKYLKELAAKNNFNAYIEHFFYQNDNFQATARKKRYEFFYQLYQNNDASAIITAHHADDRLETILMNLIKGSNLYGYAGIQETTYYQDALVIRPLINVAKKELYTYADSHNLTYFEDSSNYEDDYLRNRIRNHIVPLLKQENPSLLKNVQNYSQQLIDAFNYIRKKSINYWCQKQKILINDFLQMDQALQKDLLNFIMETYQINLSKSKIDAIIAFINSAQPNITFDLNNEYQLLKTYSEVLIEKHKNKLNFNQLLSPNESIETPVGNFFFAKEMQKNSFKISRDEAFPLTIRTRENGDILKIRDGHKKLKDFCIDKKIPLPLRNNLVIVANNRGEIIWVINYYQKKYDSKDEYYLVFEENKNE